MIRSGTPADYPALVGIYNHYVLTSGATFDLDPVGPDEGAAMFGKYAATGPHRLLVATRKTEEVIGFATSGQLRSRPAYDHSVEVTVYLTPSATGQGIGALLYDRLFAELAGEDLHRAYAVIAQPNPASVALHRRFGFNEIGTMHEVGRKHGRWWDVLWMERPLP